MSSINLNQKLQFEKDGFLDGVEIISENEMEVFREKFDKLEKTFPEGKFPGQFDNLHFKHRFLADLCVLPNLVNTMSNLLGPDLVLLNTTIMTKYPSKVEGPAFVGYHQDMKYWGMDPKISATAWIAVDPAGPNNGSMVFLPGSHTAGLQDHGTTECENNILQGSQHIFLDEEEESRLVQSKLAPGNASFHGGLTVHGSPVNTGCTRRCGLVVAYTTPEVRMSKMEYDIQYEEDFRKPVLVKGSDKFGRMNFYKTLEKMMEEATEGYLH